MLNAFGLRSHVEALDPSLINRTRLIFNQGDAIDIPLPGTALGVSRHSLDPALHHAALGAGVQVQTAAAVKSVYPHDRGYSLETIQAEGSITYQARAVIAAWGANRQAGFPGYRSAGSTKHSYIGVKSHYRGIDMEQVVELYFFPGGYLAYRPLKADSSTLRPC